MPIKHLILCLADFQLSTDVTYYAPPLHPRPKFPPNSLISYFLTLGTDLPFFLLCLPSWFLPALRSPYLVALGHSLGHDVAACLPSDSQLQYSSCLLSAFPWPSSPSLPALPPITELARRAGTHSLTSISPEQSFEHRWPLRPEVAFRAPLPNLTIPSVLALWPFLFPAQLWVSEAMPEQSQRPLSDSWLILILTSSRRSCREQKLS